MNKFNYSLLSIALITTLTGCFGGSDDTPAQQAVAIGQFVDSAVEGIEVFQDEQSLGKTNHLGQFTYVVSGGDLTFKIGKLTLGSSPAQLFVTPEDLTDNVTKQTEIMQILQTLDSDNDPSNGIVITQAQFDNLNKLEHPVNFVDSNLSPAAVVETAEPTKTTIISPTQAREHFAKTKETVTKEIANTLEGYWRSNCIKQGDISSITFNKLAKADGSSMNFEQVDYEYHTPDCSGAYDVQTKSGTHDDWNGVTVVANNQISVTYKDDNSNIIKEVYNRIPEDLFNQALHAQPTHNPDSHSADMFVGYWKSECLQTGNGSELDYSKVSKVNEQQIKTASIIQKFKTHDCSGTSTTAAGEHDGVTDIKGLNLVNHDSLTVTYTDEGRTVTERYHRITDSIYNEMYKTIS